MSFSNILAFTRAVGNDKRGAALVEYGMLVGLIAVVCIATVATLGTDVKAVFTTIATDIAAV